MGRAVRIEAEDSDYSRLRRVLDLIDQAARPTTSGRTTTCPS